MHFDRTEIHRGFWLTIVATAALLIVVALLITMRRHTTPDRVATRAEIRAEQLARLQFVAGRLTQYAREYHRPVYRFDSVVVHLDSTHAAEFRSYLTDLWGDSIDYNWNFAGFSLRSRAGLTGVGHEAAIDSAMRQAHLTMTASNWVIPEFRAKFGKLMFDVDEELYITAEYGWPEVVVRDSIRLKHWPSVDSSRTTRKQAGWKSLTPAAGQYPDRNQAQSGVGRLLAIVKDTALSFTSASS
jgi:hypothetical protein